MTPEEIETLMFIVASDRPVSSGEIAQCLCPQKRSSDLDQSMGRRFVRPLLDAGAVYRTRAPTVYAPTEKGRIAAALLMAKDPALRVAWFDGVAV